MHVVALLASPTLSPGPGEWDAESIQVDCPRLLRVVSLLNLFLPLPYLHLSNNDRTDSGSRIRKFSAAVTAFMMLFRTED